MGQHISGTRCLPAISASATTTNAKPQDNDALATLRRRAPGDTTLFKKKLDPPAMSGMMIVQRYNAASRSRRGQLLHLCFFLGLGASSTQPTIFGDGEAWQSADGQAACRRASCLSVQTSIGSWRHNTVGSVLDRSTAPGRNKTRYSY